jgi:hypothetical protein
VHSGAKHGVDLGEIVGIDPIGVLATSSMEEILATERTRCSTHR